MASDRTAPHDAAALEAELARVTACRDDYEMIGLARDAHRGDLTRIFVDASRRFHPDLYGHDARLREIAEEIFIHLSEAERRLRRTLPKPKKPRSAPAPDPVPDVTARKRPRTWGVRVEAPAPTPKADANTNEVPEALLRRMGLHKAPAGSKPTPSRPAVPPPAEEPDRLFDDSLETVPTPSGEGSPAPADLDFGNEVLYGEALSAMIDERYDEAVALLGRLAGSQPERLEFQTARELAQGYLLQAAAVPERAIRHFHRACVIDGACIDAIDAIRALRLQVGRPEDAALDRLLGNV